MNGKWIEVDKQSLYNFTLWIAQSPAELKDVVVLGLEEFIKKYLIKQDSKNRKKKER